ncbi:hypothetical protein DPMN_086552 [Dreissena polymorpha]|uniref:Uncharacterized protein n=1 Tax=Dreissena polymorpha TaxID=45954 RepID=A0A9D4KQN0_DREPO|nr:hypothetical protein DPMN_086552 [Dreissena polymorpha]
MLGLTEKAHDMRFEEELEHVRSDLIMQQLDFAQQVENKEAYIKLLEEAYDNSMDTIKDYYNRLLYRLHSLEEQTIELLNSMLSKMKTDLQSDIQRFRKSNEDLKRFQETVVDLSKEREDLSCIAYFKSKHMLSEFDKMVKQYSSEKDKIITFDSDLEIDKQISSITCLGNFKPVPIYASVSTNYLKLPKTLQSREKPNIKVDNDRFDCRVSGISEMPDGTFIIVDESNKKLKFLNKDFEIISYTDLHETPADVCRISQSGVAVVFKGDDSSGIHFVNVKGEDKLIITKTRYVQHLCFGICFSQGNLLVTSDTALYVYNLDCKLERLLYKDESAEQNGIYIQIFKLVVIN